MSAIDPTTYYGYDPAVHPLPLAARAAVGDTIDSPYVGRGTVVAVTPCDFYGAPPRECGAPIPGRWDGLRYDVDTANGRHSLDRSRLGRVTSK